jgi:hypothetical protein
MLSFVEADLVAPGELERRHQTPAAIGDWCCFNSVFLELLYGRCDIVADQPQFVFGVIFRLMDGELRRRCSEEKPAVAGVNVGAYPAPRNAWKTLQDKDESGSANGNRIGQIGATKAMADGFCWASSTAAP